MSGIIVGFVKRWLALGGLGETGSVRNYTDLMQRFILEINQPVISNQCSCDESRVTYWRETLHLNWHLGMAAIGGHQQPTENGCQLATDSQCIAISVMVAN